ncbi:Uncharacterised protein [uncultured archaeon]|nr:Uncharacterised protein [uncultured archaeon]
MAEVTRCRICQSPDLYTFLRLGPTPLANSFVRPGDEAKSEPSYPLDVCLCKNCSLVQLGYVVPPEIMFRNYIYFSSTSDTIRKHFSEEAQEVLESYAKPGELVVEIASNDGVLLKNFLGKGVRILGVEPATNIARVANDAGVETLNDFFSSKSAAEIRSEKGAASVILANNVFAHVPDLHDIVKGMGALLDSNGVIMIEFPYLADLYLKREFDTIYHEHLSYFSLKPVIHLFKSFGMEVFDAKRTPVHGGSIRIYVQKSGGRHKRNSKGLEALLKMEDEMGLYSPAAYDKFAAEVLALKKELLALLMKLKAEGKSIAAYGAPAKGNTLLNFFGIGRDVLDFAVDKSQYKQNLLTPGMHIPVYGPEMLKEKKPDYLLILAWNFADEIMRQQEGYKKAGGHFIIPIPQPRII